MLQKKEDEHGLDDGPGEPTEATKPLNIVPSIVIETIYGNLAHISLPYIREMCWYPAGIANIFTDNGCYIVRISREDYMKLVDMRKAT